jgi:hypothetical protein
MTSDEIETSVAAIDEQFQRLEALIDWRPMASARKDGRPILIWVPNAGGPRWKVAWWQPPSANGEQPGRWIFEGGSVPAHAPQNWMDLPESPEVAGTNPS